MIDEGKILEDVLNMVSVYTGEIYEDSDQNNVKTLAYISGYCAMAEKVLEWIKKDKKNGGKTNE